MKTILLLSIILVSFFPNSLSAQDQPTDTAKSEQLYVITKLDGTEYIGKIISDDGREVLIETEALGKIFIPKSDIKSMVKVKDKKDIAYGEYQGGESPFTTRYCFTTNALPIKKGANYALVNLYGPEIHFALSDNFSLGFMSTWIASPMILAAKYSIPTKNEKLNFSFGTLVGTSGYLNQFKGFGGLHFANVTLGDREQNITFSAGYAYSKTGGQIYNLTEGVYYDTSMNGPSYTYYNGPLVDKPMTKGPIFSIAGIAKVGAKASFVFDSMIGVFSDTYTQATLTTIRPIDYNNSIPGIWKTEVTNRKRTTVALFIMPAMRFQKTDRKAFQVALAGVTVFSDNGDRTSFPFPMCSWFYKF